ncbi:hypothetical protein Scep_008859 [Stephania cephalantha]|uniref:Pentatricopeptide repeat-containing protein n=1 Tax=Stephania cephalantha TaxID=152367 RepID=A0AAP0PC08_9MAGN
MLRRLWRETTRKLCTAAALPPTRPPLQRSKQSRGASLLYHRITALAINNGSLNELLNDWIVKERNQINKYDISCFVDQLRTHKQYGLALQLLEWMEKRGMHLSYSHQAKRIDLLWKSQGVEAAEKYFADLPPPAKNKATYGALLCCLCCEKMAEKAMALWEKMQAQNFVLNTFVYNQLMSLYLKLGEPAKVPLLAQEMKAIYIEPDVFTCNLLMNSYSSMNDIEGVERVVEECKKAGKIDWSVYCNLAAVYVAAGLNTKAELVLKEIERMKKLKDRKAFHYLLSLYASIGDASAVNRAWESLKSAFPKTTNLSYLTMLQTLSRLNDLDGLKKCFEEWEQCNLSYDIRLVNVILKVYLNKDMIETANSFLERAVIKGFNHTFSTYAPFIDFYVRNDQLDLAMKCLEKAIPVVKHDELHIYEEKLGIFQSYFQLKKDDDGMEELHRILKQAKHLKRVTCEPKHLNQETCGSLVYTHKD